MHEFCSILVGVGTELLHLLQDELLTPLLVADEVIAIYNDEEIRLLSGSSPNELLGRLCEVIRSGETIHISSLALLKVWPLRGWRQKYCNIN